MARRIPKVYHRCNQVALNKNGTRRLVALRITKRRKGHRTYKCPKCGLELVQNLLPIVEETTCTVE